MVIRRVLSAEADIVTGGIVTGGIVTVVGIDALRHVSHGRESAMAPFRSFSGCIS
jgi:hypothetical protein